MEANMPQYRFGEYGIDTEKPDTGTMSALIHGTAHDAELFAAANSVKQREYGKNVYIRGIIEFSNYCRCKCAYCGINCSMKTTRYRMEPEEMVRAGIETAKVYQTVILQSGEDPYYTAPMLADIVKRIKDAAGCTITLSIGERTEEEYRIMRDAGAGRFLIKHETSDEMLYQKLHGVPLETRLKAQRTIKKLGYELGGGFMVGLPGQTDETLAKDILTLVNEGVAMAGIGPYITHPATELVGSADGEPQKTLRVLALARLFLPQCHLPSTTALNVKGGMDNALNCGANVIMQKATPFAYRKLYDIYPGRDAKDVPLQQQWEELEEKLEAMGLRAV